MSERTEQYADATDHQINMLRNKLDLLDDCPELFHIQVT